MLVSYKGAVYACKHQCEMQWAEMGAAQSQFSVWVFYSRFFESHNLQSLRYTCLITYKR